MREEQGVALRADRMVRDGRERVSRCPGRDPESHRRRGQATAGPVVSRWGAEGEAVWKGHHGLFVQM